MRGYNHNHQTEHTYLVFFEGFCVRDYSYQFLLCYTIWC